GGSIVTEASTPQHQPLQEIAVPRSASAFNATLDAALNTHAQEPGSRDARALKRTIQQAKGGAGFDCDSRSQGRNSTSTTGLQEQNVGQARKEAAQGDTRQCFLLPDDLDDGEPLSAISNDEEDPFGFFETLPKPGPSRMRH
ncbi:related to transposase (fragment), partial [Sporisorium reilianum SRZ2]